jgi:uncharacterized protein (DUF1501 family)
MQITRRFFLKSSGALAAYCALTPLSVYAQAGAATQPAAQVTRRKTLVAIFLRGGADGLNLVVPHADAHYAPLRQGLAIARPVKGDTKTAIDLDGFFGLHPRMGALAPLFAEGTAVALHAVGYDRNSRSHFEEQDVWETGVIGNTVNSDGWLNRHLATSEGPGPLRAVSVGDSLPRILRGKVSAYAIRGVEDLVLPETANAAAVAAGLEHAYRADPAAHRGHARELLLQSGASTLIGMRELARLTAAKYTPAAEYPKTEIARRLGEVARLVKSDVGLEVAEVDYDGWDTHLYQGQGNDGTFATLVGNLADALAAFTKDLGDRLEDVLVMTVSEFGRTAAANGTGGTDHGWGNSLLALGGPVRNAARQHKKPVLAAWPGLAPDKLHQNRDLLHTTDFRDVLGEAVRVHLGNPNLAKVLPSHDFKSVGFVA